MAVQSVWMKQGKEDVQGEEDLDPAQEEADFRAPGVEEVDVVSLEVQIGISNDAIPPPPWDPN